MKKLYGVIISLLLLVAMVIPAMAESEPKASVADVTGNPGQKVELVVSISDCSKADRVDLAYAYDAEILELIAAESGWLVDGGQKDLNAEESKASWSVDTGAQDINGALFKLVFKIKDAAADTQTNVTISTLQLKNGETQLHELSATGKVTVKIPSVKVVLNKDTLSLDVKSDDTKTATLTATLTPDNAAEVVWATGDAKIATVENGVVTAVGIGQTTITATVGDASASCTVTVLCSHTLKKTEAKPADCQQEGNKAYYTCSVAVCGKVFKDSEGKTETTLDAEKLEKLPCSGGKATCTEKAVCDMCHRPYGETSDEHTWAIDYSVDETKHWLACTASGCTAKKGEGEHWGGVASCTEKAICADCNKPYGSLEEHKFTVLQKSDVNHWNKCANCDQKDTEIAHTYDQQVKSQQTLKTPATCAEDAVYYYSCICGQLGTEGFKDAGSATGEHVDANATREGNETEHWFTCSCSAEFGRAAHSGGTATCSKKAVCDICFLEYGELNPEVHNGDWVIRNEKPATCDEEGYSGDVCCAGCEVKLADGEPTPKTAHWVDAWLTLKPATLTENGEKTGICTSCLRTLKVTTGKLVDQVKAENVEGHGVSITLFDNSSISENVVFKAKEVLGTLYTTEMKKIYLALGALGVPEENMTIGAIYDMALVLREKSVDGEILADAKIKLEGKARVTVPIPPTLMGNLAKMKLVHIQEDGSAEEVKYTLNNGRVTFETDGFSYYVFISTDKKLENPSTEPTETTEPTVTTEPETTEPGNTQTTKNSLDASFLIWATVLAILVVAEGVVVIKIVREKRANIAEEYLDETEEPADETEEFMEDMEEFLDEEESSNEEESSDEAEE